MPIHSRPYRAPSDLARMRELLITGTQAGITASYTHPGALDWAMHNPPDENARRMNIRLWERLDAEPATLEAWAIFMPHEGTFDLFVSPAIYGEPQHEQVMDEYIAWATVRAREAGIRQLWPFWMLDYDTVAGRFLQARGFEPLVADPAPPLFERTLDSLPTVRLPPGFTVDGVRGFEDGQQRALVTFAAFGVREDWETYRANYRRFMESDVYDGARDLMVRSPDGRGASVCTIWFDTVNRIGLFEPVATHPDFQGQGLGKAVMAEGLRRMYAAGMRRAILGFDPNNAAALALYTSMGFQTACYFAIYVKNTT